jgi:hypothetical protein
MNFDYFICDGANGSLMFTHEHIREAVQTLFFGK